MSELSTATAATSLAATDKVPGLVGGNFRAVPVNLVVYYGTDSLFHFGTGIKVQEGGVFYSDNFFFRNLAGSTLFGSVNSTKWVFGIDVECLAKLDVLGNATIGNAAGDAHTFTGPVTMGHALTVNSWVKPASFTVATLPNAATAGAGARAYVTDSNATTFNATVAGGGANKIGVISDGTNWKIG